MEISIAENDNIHHLLKTGNILNASNSNRSGSAWDPFRAALEAESGETSSSPSQNKEHYEDALKSIVKTLACAQAFEDYKKEVQQ